MAINNNQVPKRRSKSPLKAYHASELFKVIPANLLVSIGNETRVDDNVSRLKGGIILQLLILGMLESNRLSTRLLAELYNSQRFSLISGKGGHQTRHSSIAERLSNINADYFEQLFNWMVDKFSRLLPASKLGKKVRSFDSTMVAISSALVDYGMRVGPIPKQGHRKHQIKFTTQFHRGLPKNIKLFTKQSHLSEQVALRQAIIEADVSTGDIVVFDAGLTKRSTFIEFDTQGILFVSRLKTGYRAEFIEVHRQIEGRHADGLEFARDDRVRLYASGDNVVEHDFRLVEVYDMSNGKCLTFVTNIWDMSAMDIARIYRQRWDIEVLFRYLKQEMNFSHLINRSENGIRVQMYAALIAAIMLVVFKEKNKIETFGMAKLRFVDQLLIQCHTNADKLYALYRDP